MFRGRQGFFRRTHAVRAALALLRVIATGSTVAVPAAAEEPEIFANLGGIEVRGDSESRIALGVGGFNIFPDQGNDESSVGFLGEFRLGEKLWFIGPAVGIMVNTDGGFFGYAGIYSDFAIGPVIITPFAGVGAYSQGHSKDLGGTFEIRSSLEIAYEFDNRQRIGLIFAHLSNAGINDSNPGEEELMLTYSLPLGF